MSTEYRRGIPSTAHVEAATRLGLLWHRRGRDAEHRTHFVVENGQVLSDYGEEGDPLLALGPVTNNERHLAYYCIRPDGTPVDWEVLDQEVARVGQPQTMACNLTAPVAPTTQAQGFRADLWQALSSHLTSGNGCRLSDTVRLDWRGFRVQNPFFTAEIGWPADFNSTDILARWTVYQELKPLYDIVDGAQGAVAMPRDVVTEWARQAGGGEIRPDWALVRTPEGLLGRTTSQQDGIIAWLDSENWLGRPLRNFAVVLDAVAERRIAERMRGQAPTVTLPVDPSSPRISSETLCVQTPQGVRPAAQPEPRRFADVRPDRHGWRWWLTFPANANDGLSGRADFNRRIEIEAGNYRWLDESARHQDFGNLRAWNDRTVIPTDEQGNPVSWESIERISVSMPVLNQVTTDANATRFADVVRATDGLLSQVTLRAVEQVVQQARVVHEESVQHAATSAVPQPFFAEAPPTAAQPGQFSNNPAAALLTPENYQLPAISLGMQQLHADTIDYVNAEISRAVLGDPQPAALPRFTTDELDDVDHSRTTKLDEVTLRRGKLPTVEQIAKYREVRARRMGGTVADALKESRIDCEVAQYVLERWTGGLGDAESLNLIRVAVAPPEWDYTYQPCATPPNLRPEWVNSRISAELSRATLDTSETPNPTAQRERQEAEERRQRLADLRQRLAAERAAQPQEMAKESEAGYRFALIEPDPRVDPAASIRAWEARQAAAKVRPTAAPPRIAKPAAVPRRPAIEVVDAEVDGLSQSEAFTALIGRAFNGRC